jgi:hypothetical protein
MANKKFSEFTTRTDTANVDFLVGYDGTTNVKIAPSNVGGGGDDIRRQNSNFNHSSNSETSWYAMPVNSQSETAATGSQEGVTAPSAGYVSKIVMKSIHASTNPTASSTAFRVEVNRSVVWTGSAISHASTAMVSISQTLGSTDATFVEGDLITVRFQANGTWSFVSAVIEYTHT